MRGLMRFVRVLAVTLLACGGNSDHHHSNIGSGTQSYSPPTTNNGGGKPTNATNATCGSADDCAWWYCECSDGAVVNSRTCTNGYCLAADGTCPGGCASFNHGSWTGNYGGGSSGGGSTGGSSGC